MCGIVGIVGSAEPPEAQLQRVRTMAAQLTHRGPDGQGAAVWPGAALGHTRLRIIDLSTGDQPIRNADGSVWVVFNGEIFNYRELRADLERRGHQFYTTSDTEVIPHLYDAYGDGFVEHLNGQFAIALWDANRRRLVLARDRVGMMPLYWHRNDQGRLAFASEIKALLTLDDIEAAMDPLALDQLMTFWSPVSPRTLFKDINELEPGHVLVHSDDSLVIRPYWQWQFPTDSKYREEAPATLADGLRARLLDATRLRLRADVPVGAYLSGGIDSSSLVQLIRETGHVDLDTFSIGFDDPALDESADQGRMAQWVQTRHHQIACGLSDIAEGLPAAIYHAEQPLVRTAPVPMGILSGLVRDNRYKVVLTGEGADEVLGGYDIFKEAKIRHFWGRNPESTRRPLLLGRLYPYLNLASGGGQAFMKQFFGKSLEAVDDPAYTHATRWDGTAQCKLFLSDEFRARVDRDALSCLTERLPREFSQWDYFNRAQYLEARTLMSGYLLNAQGDRMLMKNSVEGRFPFLDHNVIEFANTIAPRYKMQGLNEKALLKRAMRDSLPESVVRRFKQPYRAPDAVAFFTGDSALVDDLLAAPKVREYGYFDAAKIERLVKKCRSGRNLSQRDNTALVTALTVQLWHATFIASPLPAPMPATTRTIV